MIRSLLAFSAASMALGAAQPALAADPVYVMRHLQKGEGTDPPLSEQGRMNAQALARLLGNAGVVAIFATPTRRAQETGAALAAKLGVPVTSYDPADQAGLVAALTKVEGAALVVGHSNTVPEIVAGLGGARPAPLGEQDFGTIFVVRRGAAATCEIALGAPRPCVDEKPAAH